MRLTRQFILTGLLLAGGSLRAETNSAALVSAALLERNVVYLRVGQVAAELADELKTASGGLVTTNQIIGTVLDLRFADGNAAEAVAGAADFVGGKKLPLAILVNGETRGAAAALATALREARAGLVFGSAAAGLKPDIAVAVAADEEKIFFADAYAVLTNGVTLTATNLAGRDTNRPLPRISEADLVRARREGAEDTEAQAERTAAAVAEKPVVRDPVLARALDLLKGLAILRSKRVD